MPSQPATTQEPTVMLTEAWSNNLDQPDAANGAGYGRVCSVPAKWHLRRRQQNRQDDATGAFLLSHRRTGTPLLDKSRTACGDGKSSLKEGRVALVRALRQVGLRRRRLFLLPPVRRAAALTPDEFDAPDAQPWDPSDPRAAIRSGQCSTRRRAISTALRRTTADAKQERRFLSRLTEQGLAMLCNHHPSKRHATPGQAARGSARTGSALSLTACWSCTRLRRCPAVSPPTRCSASAATRNAAESR